MHNTKKFLVSFNDILDVIGASGWFQKRYWIIFIFFGTFSLSQTYFNYVVALSIPDHWCQVPGRNGTRYTEKEWKNVTIPKKYDEWGNEIYSNCQMYDLSKQNSAQNPEIVDCQFGWEYNTTWYQETVISRENWVCDRDFYAPNIMSFGRLSEIFGCLLFSYIGDIYGRKTIFVITFCILVLGRLALLFTSYSFSIFLAVSLFGNFASVNMLLGALVIGMEISGESDRSGIMLLQTSGWAMGMAGMALSMWAFGNWQYFLLATTLPGLICLMLVGYMPESPRWLMTQGKISRCIKELHKIAKTNKTHVPDDAVYALTSLSKVKSKNYGMISFFSQWRIAKNTVCINASWVASGLSYFVLILYFGKFGSNPFLTSFFQGIIELPANLVGMLMCNYFGRRWAHVFGHAGTMLGSLVLIFTINDPNMEWLVATLTVVLKFTVALTIYVVCLHTMETYPTCLRQSGIALGNLTSILFSVLGPYIVYMGTTMDSRFPFMILLVMALVAGICVSLLPETLHCTLPETLNEAKEFGFAQTFWSLPKQKKEFQLVTTLEK